MLSRQLEVMDKTIKIRFNIYLSVSDYPGIPPAAVSQRVGRVWQSSAALSLGAAGSRPGITAVGAGLLTHRTPGQTLSLVCSFCFSR